MLATNLVTILDRFERNFHSAYVTWYEKGLDNFLEPCYTPDYILDGSPEVDWTRSRTVAPNMFIMRDGSAVMVSPSGKWFALPFDKSWRTW